MLEALPGWDWRCPSLQDEWQEVYDELREWLKSRDGVFPQMGVVGLEFWFFSWIESQKRNYQDCQKNAAKRKFPIGKVYARRFQLLEQIPGWTWVRCKGVHMVVSIGIQTDCCDYVTESDDNVSTQVPLLEGVGQ